MKQVILEWPDGHEEEIAVSGLVTYVVRCEFLDKIEFIKTDPLVFTEPRTGITFKVLPRQVREHKFGRAWGNHYKHVGSEIKTHYTLIDRSN